MIIPKPVIHLNGSGAATLRNQYAVCLLRIDTLLRLPRHHQTMAAVIDLADGLQDVEHTLPQPNSRDYYPNGGDAITAAMESHHAQLELIAEVEQSLHALLDGMDEHNAGEDPDEAFREVTAFLVTKLTELREALAQVADHIDFPIGFDVCTECGARISRDLAARDDYRRHLPSCSEAS